MAGVGILLLSLLAAVHLCAAEEVKLYNGYKLIRAYPTTKEQVNYLSALQEDESLEFKLDFWSEPFLNKPCDINVPPEAVAKVMGELRKEGIRAVIVQSDVQSLIENTKLGDKVASLLVKAGISRESAFNIVSQPDVDPKWLSVALKSLLTSVEATQQDTFGTATQFAVVGTFARHADINAWLDQMAASYPSLASTESIGTSYEGRTMKTIKVGSNPSGRVKPIIWVDAAIHAREWLTVGTTIHIINKLLTTYQTDSVVRDLLDTYTWYFLPVVNPDGYEYTHVSDRLWRKTRSPTSSKLCPGADPNRNFDFQWRVSGTSTSACSDTYGGPSAFSEKETQNLRDAILRLKSNMKLYVGLHSYSQMWLTPWAYGSAKPADNADMMSVATAGEAALYAKYKTRFTIGAPPDILYAASGGSYDWVKGVAGVKYAYTLELRPDANAANGFVVSENQITPSGEEVWAGLAAIAQILKTK